MHDGPGIGGHKQALPAVALSELTEDGERNRRRAAMQPVAHDFSNPSYDASSGLIYYREKATGAVRASTNVHDVRVMCETQPDAFELVPRDTPVTEV